MYDGQRCARVGRSRRKILIRLTEHGGASVGIPGVSSGAVRQKSTYSRCSPDVEAVEVAPARDEVEVRLDEAPEAAPSARRDVVKLALDQALGLDLEVLGVDLGRLGGGLAQVRERRLGLVVAALLDEPAGRVRHEEERDAKDDSREDLDTDGDAPCRLRLAGAASGGDVVEGVKGRVAILDRTGVRDVRGAAGATDVRGAIGNPVREEDTESDRELLAGDERAAEVGRSELRMKDTRSGPALPHLRG